ncbi:MAG: SDR family NAD(P)-dependent oxidoreductase [Pseudomonadota bacterium]
MKTLAGKTIIITGASAGVGLATARLLATHQAKLVLLARGQEALNRVTEELSALTDVCSHALDVCDADAYQAVLIDVAQRFGPIHGLINNAGYHQRGYFEQVSAQDHVMMVDVNLAAPLNLIAQTLPYLKEAGEGAVVNVGSLAGRAPLEGGATYSATKAGLRAVTYALHDELRAHNVMVGLVSPGPISTGFILDRIDEVDDIVFSQPMSSPEQVAYAILAVVKGERVEVSLPRVSGGITMLSYLFPRLRRWSRPLLMRLGRRHKQRYLKTARSLSDQGD